jgi:hypothetical protein
VAPTGPVTVDRRFNEIMRDEPFDPEFRQRRYTYVTGTDHPGWPPWPNWWPATVWR